MGLKLYTLNIDATIYNALEQIERNKKGFVIITDKNDIVQGTLTDGDIRRSILKGKDINNSIDGLFSQDFSYVYIDDSFEKVIELFKSSKFNFAPIITKNGKLLNIITKAQLHTALLEGIEWDFNFDFTSLDKRTIDHEIYNRPWGYYKTVFLSDYSRAKIIQVNPGEELSLQEHKQREEHWVIVKGMGELTIGESNKIVLAGSYIYIPKGCMHRIKNISDDSPLMISEVQLGEYFGEDDIIRYEDRYGRANINGL